MDNQNSARSTTSYNITQQTSGFSNNQGISQGGTIAQQVFAQQRQQQLQSQQGPPASVPGSSNPLGSSPFPQTTKLPEDYRKKVPNALSEEYFGDFSGLTVGELVSVARELVQELTIRVGTTFSLMNMKSDKQPPIDPQVFVTYNMNVFYQLLYISILISEKMGKEVPLDNLIEELKDMTDPPDTRSKELVELEDKFKENRKKLSDISCDLKFLDWTAAVSDPLQLKRVDKMQMARDPTSYH